MLTVVAAGRAISQLAVHLRSPTCSSISEWPRAFDPTNIFHRRIVSSIKPITNPPPNLDIHKLAPLLSNWLPCSTTDAQDICKALVKSRLAPVNELRTYVHFLLQHGFTPATLRAHPRLLEQRLDVVQPRVLLLESIGVTTDNAPLLNIQTRRLQLAVAKWMEDAALFNSKLDPTSTVVATNYSRYANRLEYLGVLLDCPPSQVAHLAVKHPQLLTFDLDRIDRVLTLLQANGITTDAIKNDLWIIQHNEATIQDRVHRAKEARLPVIKTWMLRCPEATFANTVDKWCRNRDVLCEHQDTIGYLAQRLNCTREYTEFVAKRNPRLLSINLPKLKQVLDFVYANGYDSSLVSLQPRIFSLSIATLQKRMQDLEQLGYKPKTLDILCLDAKRFDRLIAKLRKKKTE